MATTPLQQLDPLEIVSGAVTGPRRAAAAPDPPPIAGDVRTVLDGVLLEALSEPPCHVAFSGGRDSSVVLAAATHTAREHGLADPVPLTARYPRHPRTHEDEWQEAVVRHLGLREWTTFSVTDELDALGEIATGALRRHGPYWPFAAHTMILTARTAGRGTLLTGGGGDELFSFWPGRRMPLNVLRRMPRRRAAKFAALNAVPSSVRQRVHARRGTLALPWLRPDALRAVSDARRANGGPSPSWAAVVTGLPGSRYYELVRTVLDAFARDEGVRLVEPLYDPRVIGAVAAAAPRDGYPGRGPALEALFGDLLPRDVLYRSTKATFTDVAWGPAARAFAETWDGSGLDNALVDPDALRAQWARPTPDGRCLGCLQLAWLAAQ